MKGLKCQQRPLLNMPDQNEFICNKNTSLMSIFGSQKYAWKWNFLAWKRKKMPPNFMDGNSMHKIVYSQIFNDHFWGEKNHPRSKLFIFIHWNTIFMYENVIFPEWIFYATIFSWQKLFDDRAISLFAISSYCHSNKTLDR